MKGKCNIIIWGLVLLAVIYCGMYWYVNRESIGEVRETALLVEEGSGDSDGGNRDETDHTTEQERFLEIFAEIAGEGDAKIQKIKLFVTGKNAYFFLPSYCKTDSMVLRYDEHQFELALEERDIPSGTAFYMDGADASILTLTREDGTKEHYELRVMQSANLPSIFITTANHSMDYINDMKGNYEPGHLVCVNNLGGIDCDATLEKVKLHGFTSLSVPKKTYQVDFCESEDLLGMGSASHWIFQANAYDKSYMRNKLVYDMFQGMTSNYAVESEFADVYYNGEYAGNYLICEKIEAGVNRIELADNAAAYTADNAKGQVIEEEDIRYFDTLDEDTSGGYLIETQNVLVSSDLLRMSEEDSYFISDSGRYEIRWPKEISKAQIFYIRDYMKQVETQIAGCVSEKDYRQLAEIIDIDSFALMYLIDLIANDVDANAYSTFYYKLPEQQGGKLYAGPVWDYDRGFGNEERNVHVNVNGYWNGPCEALYQNKLFRNRVRELYYERFLPLLENILYAFLEETPDRIALSIKMDSARWQNSLDRLNYSYDCFEEEVAFLSYYFHERAAIASEWINETGVYHMVTFTVPQGVSKSCFIRDGEFLAASVLSLMREELQCEIWSHENGNIYQQGRPVFGDMTLYGSAEE
ncbi:MAG: CotH kinase family protein [Lachnospiraceae bacterium]|nr:CotH kinase family protein [Lachnospiraceae bacterium]